MDNTINPIIIRYTITRITSPCLSLKKHHQQNPHVFSLFYDDGGTGMFPSRSPTS